MREKVIVISGATNGIGKATALKLASFGSHIIMLARDLEKAKKVKSDFLNTFPEAKIDIVYIDFSDLESVSKAANELITKYPTIDILINNAGGIFNKFEKTNQALESGYQVNHIAPFLLTEKLIPALKKSKEARIINVASDLHKFAKFKSDDFNLASNFSGWTQYANTKFMNIISAKYWSEKYGILSFSLHPGVVKTSFGSNNTGFWSIFGKIPFLITPEDGAKTTVYLASQEKEKLSSGSYYKKMAKASTSSLVKDIALGDKIIAASLEIIKSY